MILLESREIAWKLAGKNIPSSFKVFLEDRRSAEWRKHGKWSYDLLHILCVCVCSMRLCLVSSLTWWMTITLVRSTTANDVKDAFSVSSKSVRHIYHQVFWCSACIIYKKTVFIWLMSPVKSNYPSLLWCQGSDTRVIPGGVFWVKPVEKKTAKTCTKHNLISVCHASNN